ncbi:hypothetical protein BJY52DRAFT_1194328 [Lactarius psammicola]|nr:hypothetical protein BJY52DRAFT_1194328 [Lactarius psammicola]
MNQHAATVTEAGNVAGKKRPRRQSRVAPALTDGGDEAPDGADVSSDSQRRGRNKRPKLMARPKGSEGRKPPTKRKVQARRNLEVPIDWSDDSWEKRGMQKELAEAIERCKKSKSTGLDANPCPVLSLTQLSEASWSPELRCFICLDHFRLVPGNSFRRHFGGRLHPGPVPGGTRYDFFTASALHLGRCYPNIQNQSYEGLKDSLPTQLPAPLLEKESTCLERYKCPVGTCGAWVAANKQKGAPVSELRRHVKDTHKGILENYPPVSPQWTQLVGVGDGNNLNGGTHCFTFPEAYQGPHATKPQKPAFASISHAALHTDTWAVSLGWEDHIEQIATKLGSRQSATDKLRDLVSLPSLHRISMCTGSTKIIEEGLLLSNRLNIRYLEDAATWVSLMHSSFRDHFRHGGKKPFQPFANKGQYYKYRKALIITEGLVVRSMHDKVCGRSDIIPALHSRETAQAGLDLYRCYLGSHGRPNTTELMVKKHELFLAILRAGEGSERKVGCPLDLAIMASSLLANGQWRKASLVRSLVATALWSLSAVDAHWCRLATTGDERYIPFSRADPHLIAAGVPEVEPPQDPSLLPEAGLNEDDPLYSETDEGEEEEDQVEISSDELPDGLGLDEVDMAEIKEALQHISQGLDMPSQPSAGLGARCQMARPFNAPDIKQELKSRLKYICPTGESNLLATFQRTLSTSLTLFSAAEHKPPFTTAFQNGSFILTNSMGPPVSLPLEKFREAAALSTTRLKNCVEAALPAGISIYDIPVHRLTDDFSSVAIHKQPQNAVILQPLASRCWRDLLAGPRGDPPLFDSNGVVRIEVDKWLKKYDDCYPSAATAMVLNSGALDPHAFKHYCYNGPSRNIFLLRNGQLSFACPPSPHRTTGSRLALVTMPADVTLLLLVIMGILLPIATELRALKGQTLPYQHSHLWNLPRRHTTGDIKWCYSSIDINKQLMDLTGRLFGVNLDGEIIRKMVHQVFSSEFPLLLNNSMHLRSPVDDLAQHLWITGLHNYGKLGHFPTHSALTGDKPARHLVYCEIWHALTGTGPIHEGWRMMVQGTALFPDQTFLEDALNVARQSVLVQYGVLDASGSAEREELVKNLLSKVPFLRGITPMDKAIAIGDTPLRLVLRALILGPGQINGHIPSITETHVAESAILLMRALCEWATGDFVDLSHPGCESAMHFETLRSRLLTKLVENKFHESEPWMDLRVKVGMEVGHDPSVL